MPMNVKVSGSWRDVTPYVKVSGSWRAIDKAWVKVSGSWRVIYESAVENYVIRVKEDSSGTQHIRVYDTNLQFLRDITSTIGTTNIINADARSDVGYLILKNQFLNPGEGELRNISDDSLIYSFNVGHAMNDAFLLDSTDIVYFDSDNSTVRRYDMSTDTFVWAQNSISGIFSLSPNYVYSPFNSGLGGSQIARIDVSNGNVLNETSASYPISHFNYIPSLDSIFFVSIDTGNDETTIYKLSGDLSTTQVARNITQDYGYGSGESNDPAAEGFTCDDNIIVLSMRDPGTLYNNLFTFDTTNVALQDTNLGNYSAIQIYIKSDGIILTFSDRSNHFLTTFDRNLNFINSVTDTVNGNNVSLTSGGDATGTLGTPEFRF